MAWCKSAAVLRAIKGVCEGEGGAREIKGLVVGDSHFADLSARVSLFLTCPYWARLSSGKTVATGGCGDYLEL